MPFSFDYIEAQVNGHLRSYPKDRRTAVSDNPKMPSRKKIPVVLRHPWFLREWMAHFEKIQADLQKELGWSLGKASEVYNGQPYRQELVEEVSGWLKIAPYELLMHPDEAAALRRLRDTAATVVEVSKIKKIA